MKITHSDSTFLRIDPSIEDFKPVCGLVMQALRDYRKEYGHLPKQLVISAPDRIKNVPVEWLGQWLASEEADNAKR
ncbi:MAG: hypothetical protein V3W37_03075 [Candidatus Binatia bacterium]